MTIWGHSKRPGRGWTSRFQACPLAGIGVTLALCLLFGVGHAAETMFPAGNYALVSQMMMPHLDEMRRIATEESRCLSGERPDALFPVLRQSALRGCRLGYEERDHNTRAYVLECASARVASGRARLTLDGPRIIGLLEVKMGGKNMTFSQRVVATPQGACRSETSADEAVSRP